jgi:hypothetical protein
VIAPEPDIAAMWRAHYDRQFPPLLQGAEVGNIDLVLLDADTAGCVSSWLSNGGHLDPKRALILEACVKDLDTVLAVFVDGEELHYLQRLRILALAVLVRTKNSARSAAEQHGRRRTRDQRPDARGHGWV